MDTEIAFKFWLQNRPCDPHSLFLTVCHYPYGRIEVEPDRPPALQRDLQEPPKAVESLRRDEKARLAFYDFPAEHWKNIRTSNPIESTFSTVRLRQRVTKGPGSKKRGLLMAFRPLEMAGMRWRRLNAAQLLPVAKRGFSSPTELSSSERLRPPRRRRRRGSPLDHPNPPLLTIPLVAPGGL